MEKAENSTTSSEPEIVNVNYQTIHIDRNVIIIYMLQCHPIMDCRV